jgi:uncharacterized membrane protein
MNDDLRSIDSANRTTILVHYYRAMVGRADVWRTRMDTTTNWAIGATAAIISFTLGNDSVPHYVVSIAVLMTLSFLLLEARRLTFYNLWQQRVLLLEEGLIRQALVVTRGRGEGDRADSDPLDEALGEVGRNVDLSTALDAHLGRTVPTMPLVKAVARRLRRVYLYLFAVQLLAWSLKLANHPTPATSFATIVERAHAGVLSGELVIATGAVLAFSALAISIVRGGVDRDPS